MKDVRSLGAAQGGGEDYQVVASGMADKITAAMAKGLAQPDFKVQRVDYVGPQVGNQLRNKGVAALIYAMVAILVYVAFRFDFKFGPGALVAMVHDVIMVSGYYLVSRREFNLTSIAVLLTITGYSINDTIVIYDRIREEMARYKGKPLPEIINIAVNDTLSRTILTSGVTALSLVGLLDLRGGRDLGLRDGDADRHHRRDVLQRVHRQPAHHLARPACGEEEGRRRSDEGPRGLID